MGSSRTGFRAIFRAGPWTRPRGRVSTVAIGKARVACTVPSCRMRKDHASAVMGILHRAALNMVRAVQQNCQD